MKTKMSNYRNCFALAYVLLAVVFLSSCDAPAQYVQLPKDQPYLIIQKTELSDSKTLGRYRYTTKDNTGDVVFYLEEKMNIGDTLWVGKNYR